MQHVYYIIIDSPSAETARTRLPELPDQIRMPSAI